ncbi:MAG: fibronectin type III domain-containing protein [Proteobacteria bacterium]|nr:fibronectin type III domain-containing protein [Pseudomonadota bacterium]
MYHPKLSLLMHTSLLAIPGAPRNVRAAQVSERDNDNDCIILVEWDPPTNVDESDIDHYIITVPSQNITENELSTIITVRERNCRDDDAIQVAAVSRFGCVGENSLQTQPSLLGDNTRTAGSTTGTPIGSTTSTPTGSTFASGKD